MRPQRLRNVLESLTATSGSKNLSGEIKNVDKLLSGTALRRLENQHRDAFALIVYNPYIDSHIHSYLVSNALANDTGRLILALYELAPNNPSKPMGPDSVLRVEGENPLIAFARDLFPRQAVLLPGIVILPILTSQDAVYASPSGLNSKENTSKEMRRVFAIVSDQVSQGLEPENFSQSCGVQFAKEGIPFLRSDGLSVEEQLVKLLRVLWTMRRDLAALIPVVGKLVDSKKDRSNDND